jgi:hypothetical protein
MLGSLFKKKVNPEKVANYFVNHLMKLIDGTFEDFITLIKLDPEFDTQPQIQSNDSDKLLFIVIAGNLKLLPQQINNGKEDEILDAVYKKLASVYDVTPEQIKKVISEYHNYFSRVNFPSKNILYAMSKTVFFDYQLNQYQAEYFRKLSSPNPIFLKHLDEMLKNYLIDWVKFQETYKIVD